MTPTLELENYVQLRYKPPAYIITDFIMICTDK